MSAVFPVRDDLITTSELSKKAGIHLPAIFLKQLGCVSVYDTKTSVMWNEKDVPKILGMVSAYFLEKSLQELE